MKKKKTKKEITKTGKIGEKRQTTLACSNSKDLTNVMFIFFVFISLLYGFLIYNYGKTIEKETAVVIPYSRPNKFQKEIGAITRGYPMEKMSSYIARKDKRVASFLIAIGKKESNWGKYSPRKSGQDCYNYWGYRGSENPTSSGYSCFEYPRQAVNVVGGRIQKLVDQKIDTPQEMAVWKCGFDCSWDNPARVNKWVADVDYYYNKI